MNDDVQAIPLALVNLPYQSLAALLQLPPGARIDLVQSNPYDHEIAVVRVRGAGWLTLPGDRIQTVPSRVTEYRDDDGRCFKRVITWDMPTYGT